MRLHVRALSTLLAILFPLSSLGQTAPWRHGSEAWEYNPGPDPKTVSGKALIDIYAELPEYMAMSEELMEAQKFRYIFGLMMTRAYFETNAVKVLFVGQDATHIAEAAKQPGTSGFGARVQSIGNYFGVDQSVATTNAFLSTIKGQYGSFDHLYVDTDKDGKRVIRQSAFVDNELWLLANGRDSEVLIKREAFWEWMIKNNPQSLSLMVMFGGAARDAWAEFLIGRGAKVGTKFNPERLKTARVPETKLVPAGGNNEFPVLLNKEGKDLYQILAGRRLDYSKPADQAAAVKAVRDAGDRAIDMMVFTNGGVSGSGIVNAAQLGGYDLDEVEINGQRTNSIKGLKLSDGTVVQHDIGFTMSAHPSSLSKMEPKAASEALKKSFARLDDLKKTGWRVEPDLDEDGKPRINSWDKGIDYSYGRADIRAGYFEFGAPDDRRVSRADASRLDAQVIVAGSRDRVQFDKELIANAKKAMPSESKNPLDLWSVRPRQQDTRAIFDRGPGPEIAELLMTHLSRDQIFEPKAGMKVTSRSGVDQTFETHGIDAFNVKTHPGTGFFGLHRGSFQDAKVLILADPHGIDDWNTSRALTGARGQYLNGLMNDLGVGENYLVIKTVPVGMDGATAEEWEVTRQKTEAYRDVAVKKALENGKIQMIFTDGAVAQFEMSRILKKLGASKVRVVNIQREGMDPASGILKAGQEVNPSAKISAQMRDIPRSHLPWWARTWEGTSGDRVIDALGKERGGVRALVAPNWVARQEVTPSPRVAKSIQKLRETMQSLGLRIGKQTVPEFLDQKKTKEGIREIPQRSLPNKCGAALAG